jgi:hypothetical protein
MKQRKYIFRVSIVAFVCLLLLGAAVLSGCGKKPSEITIDETERIFDEYYEKYGVRLAIRMEGYVNSSVTYIDDPRATIHVVGIDTSREEIVIPDTVSGYPIVAIEVARGYDVYDCGSLKKLVISKNITSIKDDIDDGSITGWSLECFEVAEDNPVFCSEGGIVYNKDKTEIVWVPKGIKGTVTLPDMLTELKSGGAGFDGCRNLEGLIIPDSVQNIPSQITACDSLKTLVTPFIPDSFSFDDKGAILTHFLGHDSPLESLTVSRGEISTFELPNLKKLILGDGVELSSECSFTTYETPSVLEEVRLPSNMTEIPDHMFSGCSALKMLVIPESVTSIGNDAFSGCSSLKSINIPKKVTVINEGLLSGCSSLETLYFNAENITEVNTYHTFSNTGADTDGVTIIIGRT